MKTNSIRLTNGGGVGFIRSESLHLKRKDSDKIVSSFVFEDDLTITRDFEIPYNVEFYVVKEYSDCNDTYEVSISFYQNGKETKLVDFSGNSYYDDGESEYRRCKENVKCIYKEDVTEKYPCCF